jgi:hypothetical protein
MFRLRASCFAFTPTVSIPLAGYAHRLAPYEKVDQGLEAILLLVSDDQGREVVLGSVDTLYLSAKFVSDLSETLGGDFRTPCFLFATHTHFAPSLAPELPLLGECDPTWYRRFFLRCGSELTQLPERPSEFLTLAYGEEMTDLNVNRRRSAFFVDYPTLLREHRLVMSRQMVSASNASGIVDRRVRAIFFENERGAVKAIVWCLAAHPARYPASNRVSPDFPGLIREKLRQQFGKDCAVVYLPGFAGSAVPNVPLRMPMTVNNALLSVLPFYPTLRTFDEKGYQNWVNRLFSAVMRAYENRERRTCKTFVETRSTTVDGIFKGRSNSSRASKIDLQISRILLGSGLSILAFNGEMLGEWMPLLKDIGSTTVLFSGYLAGEALYIPTSAQLPEGGYEVASFQKHFALAGEFDPTISERVVSATEQLFQNSGIEGMPTGSLVPDHGENLRNASII